MKRSHSKSQPKDQNKFATRKNSSNHEEIKYMKANQTKEFQKMRGGPPLKSRKVNNYVSESANNSPVRVKG